MVLFSRTYRLLQWSATLAAGLPEKTVIDTSRPLQGRLRLGPPHKLGGDLIRKIGPIKEPHTSAFGNKTRE